MGKDKGKKGSIHDQIKFEGPGVDFKSKLIGIAEVSAPRGDDICQEAISELKAAALKNNKEKKEHKQKITVNITLKGIRLIDETTERIDHAHPIQRISFISHDKDDKRTFGYIVGTKEGYKLFAIRTIKEAELITATLKELFQEVFKRHQAKKEENQVEDGAVEVEEKENKNENEINGHVEVAEEAVESSKEPDDSQLIWDELNEQIQEMQNVGISHSDSFDMLDDPFRGGEEETKETKERSDPFDDNFSSITSTQKNFNPFDELRSESSNNEKIDFFALPSPDDIRRNNSNDLPSPDDTRRNNGNDNDLFSVEPIQQSTNTQRYSEDLYAVPNPPSSRKEINKYSEDLYAVPNPSSRKEINENEAPLMKHDPFDELKKNINELHKQNTMHQQQQQLAFTPAFPSHMNQQVPIQIYHPNPYISNIPNPFMVSDGYSNSLPPPIPARPTQQIIPTRQPPGVPVTNPFLSHQQPSNHTNSDPGMVWGVMEPSSTIKKEVIKPNAFVSDPFSFLDDQTDLKNDSKPMATTTNNFGGNKELLDLLG